VADQDLRAPSPVVTPRPSDEATSRESSVAPGTTSGRTPERGAREARPRTLAWGGTALLLVILIGLGVSMAAQQAQSRDALLSRFDQRAALAATFIDAELQATPGAPSATTEAVDGFLATASPVRDSFAYLIDREGRTLTGGGSGPTLRELEPAVATAYEAAPVGVSDYDRDGETFHFVAVEVGDRDLTLLVSAPLAAILEPMTGWPMVLPWAALGLTALAGGLAIALLVRSVRRRLALQASHLELESLTAELRRSNRELEEFAYLASHDLQEPLRKVVSYSELLRRRYHGQLDDDADEFIDYAVDGARRMQTLVQELLAYSRVSRGAIDSRPVELDDVVARALEVLSVAASETDAVILVDPLPGVQGDEEQLVLLMQNLLSNALKFHGDAAPAIRVTAKRAGASVRLRVEDEGIGIPPEYAQRVFGIFQRLHARSAYEGTGIGLAICQRVAERHGGSIRVVPSPPPGTTVEVTLPATTEPV
jgi:signal transduction histidine kinase